jgi:thymidylate synthase
VTPYDIAYHNLVEDVLAGGTRRPSRVGDTIQAFGTSLHINMRDGFPLLTTRKMFPGPIFGELSAFLDGKHHVRDFQARGCNYWNADAERWGKGGDLGRIYGVQWRQWRYRTATYVDQLQNLIEGLVEDPFSRRHILTAWNPGELREMALPPCHILAQFNYEEEGEHAYLDVQVVMRSVDLMLGLPADVVLYATLLQLVCNTVNASGMVSPMVEPRYVRFALGDTHIYGNHISTYQGFHADREGATIRPQLFIDPLHNTVFNFDPSYAVIVNYTPDPIISYKLNT